MLENVTEAQDIAVQPGAVWELPERARAYLLDLLQGGGVKLHVDYVDLIYRDAARPRRVAAHAPSARTARGLSGVALNIELDPLLKKVQRKRLIRGAAFRRRNEMVLRILEQYTGESATRRTARASSGARAAARPQPPRRGRDARSSPRHPLAPPRRGRARRRGPGGGVRALAAGEAACLRYASRVS